jgi:AcrR family transcriptional regulator
MTDARIARTRTALAEALLTLAGEKDFGEITIGEITTRAAVGYATFFRHYEDKEALLADVADVLLDELLEQMLPALITADTLQASISLCRFVGSRRAICRALLAGGASANIRSELVRRAGARATDLSLPHPAGLTPDLLIPHAVAATLGLLAWWLDQDRLDETAMGAIIDRLVIGPVRSG